MFSDEWVAKLTVVMDNSRKRKTAGKEECLSCQLSPKVRKLVCSVKSCSVNFNCCFCFSDECGADNEDKCYKFQQRVFIHSIKSSMS